jgi:hypothetical protein
VLLSGFFGFHSTSVKTIELEERMSSSNLVVSRTAVAGMFLISTAMGAQAATVSRCNVLLDGVYRPVLLVVANGEKTVHHIGENGLTRSIVFNPDAALQWAAAAYGADVEYGGNTCGIVASDSGTDPVPVPPSECGLLD